MTAPQPFRSPIAATSPDKSIDDLDAVIRRLATGINAQSYRFLVLVREFDDRFGWAKWSCRSCAEWLAWRCGLSQSAAREHVRTAHALRTLPAISAAFAEGALSYSKVRALTRAAQMHDEDLLLAYALQATAAQVEERCRQIRNVAPESADEAQRSWRRRSLSIWRNASNGTLRITVELPIEEGEVVARAIERAVEAGDVASGPELGEQSWHAQQADALVAVAKTYLDGGASESSSTADYYQVVVHVDDKSLRGGAGRSDLPIDTVKRLTCDGSLLTIVEDVDGTPLDVGRKKRTVSTALKRALWSRDRGCTFPGCASRPPLGRRRRHERRQPHAALLVPSSAAARGRLAHRDGRRREPLLPTTRRSRDPALRLPTGRHARRRHRRPRAVRRRRHLRGGMVGFGRESPECVRRRARGDVGATPRRGSLRRADQFARAGRFAVARGSTPRSA